MNEYLDIFFLHEKNQYCHKHGCEFTDISFQGIFLILRNVLLFIQGAKGPSTVIVCNT